MINYKFDEGKLIEEFKAYIDSTYGGHYSRAKFQATEFIFDSGHGIGFTIGNVLKYAQRYGKKGTHADARKDLQKILHYTLMAMHLHDEAHCPDLPKSQESEDDIIAHATKILGNKKVLKSNITTAPVPTSVIGTTIAQNSKKSLAEEIREIEILAREEERIYHNPYEAGGE